MNIEIRIVPIKWYRNTKYFLQRLFRGYGDDDLWGITTLLVKKIRKPLKAFIENNIKNYTCVPGDFMKYDKHMKATVKHKDALREWNNVQKKMVKAFDLLYEEEFTDKWCKKTTKQHIQDNEDTQEGLKLFGEYFQALWN